MRIGIVGAGAVGGYFGGRLAASGADVTFIARGAHGQAMREGGLHVLSGKGDLHLNPARVLLPGEQAAPFDLLLFTVKIYDLEPAARELAPLLAADGLAVPFENGVEARAILADILGAERVANGIAYIAGHIEAPGTVRQVGSMARLLVGDGRNRHAARLEAFAGACRAAGLDITVTPAIEAEIWRKFVFLAPFSGITCYARAPIGKVRAEPDLWRRFEALVREAVAVASARGIDFGANEADERLAFARGLPDEMRSSTLIDLEGGRRLELDWLLGAVVRLGEAAGIATPVARETLNAIQAGP
jgi:2-dehydropantoate 2-reductase